MDERTRLAGIIARALDLGLYHRDGEFHVEDMAQAAADAILAAGYARAEPADDLDICPDCMGSGDSGLGFSQACQTCDGSGGVAREPRCGCGQTQSLRFMTAVHSWVCPDCLHDLQVDEEFDARALPEDRG